MGLTETQTAISPPLLRVMTTVAERGRLVEAASVWLAGQWLVMVVRLPSSPGCWTPPM